MVADFDWRDYTNKAYSDLAASKSRLSQLGLGESSLINYTIPEHYNQALRKCGSDHTRAIKEN